jgi:predicted nucleic acid-binding protein
MSARRFLDTNILLYSISADPTEAAKRERAIALLESDDVALSVQVLQEFYVQATRSTRVDRLPHDIAVGLVEAWLRFPLQEMTRGVLLAALEIKAAHGFSYWDSAIIAAARALGCREVLTEDMSHGREVAGVRIVDPFR